MKVRINIIPGTLLLMLATTPVLAADRSQTIYIESDTLHVKEKEGVSHFNGHVKLKQGNLVIHADSIRASGAQGKIDSVLIKGNPVKLNQQSTSKPPITASANKIEYFADSEMVHLYGNALLQQGSQQFNGEHIQYHSRSQQVIANGSQQTVNSNGQGRVKAVIMPTNKKDPGN